MRWKIYYTTFIFLITNLVSPGFSSSQEIDDLIDNIERNLNVSQDYLLMRRLALVETDFGEEDPTTYLHPDGGVWQISLAVHEYLETSSSNPDVASLLAEVQRSFGISCLFCNYDYSDPVRSSLAARIYAQVTTGRNSPITVTEQAEWWSTWYHTGGNQSMFTNKVFESEDNYGVKNDLSLDVWCMMDGSVKVDEDGFQKSLNFTSTFAQDLTTSCPSAQVGFSVCSQHHDVYSHLTGSSSLSSFQAKVSSATQPQVNTSRNVGYALQNTLNEGFNSADRIQPSNVSQALVFVCGGRSSDSLSTPLQNAYDAGLDVYAVTIGDEEPTDNQMLPEIDSNHTLPSPSYLNLRNSSFQRMMRDMIIAGSASQLANQQTLADVTFGVVCRLVKRDRVRQRFLARGFDPPSYPESEELEKEVVSKFKLPEMNCTEGEIDAALKDEEDPEVLVQQEEDAGRGEELFAQMLQIFIGDTLRYNVSSYMTNVLRLEKSKWTMKLWFSLDGSRNVSDENFLSILNFSAGLAEDFKTSPQVKMGFSVFDEGNNIIVGFDEANDSAAIQSAILSTERQEVTKVTGTALRQIRDDGFNVRRGARPPGGDMHRVIVMVTAGGATDDVTTVSDLIHDEGIVVFAIGIGREVNKRKINAIASKPANKFAFHLKSFDELEPVMITLLFYRMNRFFVESTTTTSTTATSTTTTTATSTATTSTVRLASQPATSSSTSSNTITTSSTTTAQTPTATSTRATLPPPSTNPAPTSGVVVNLPLETSTKPVAFSPAPFSSMGSVIQSRIAMDPNEGVPGDRDFQSGGDTSYQAGILVSLLFLLAIAVATAFIVVKKRSLKITDEEANVDMSTDKLLRELRMLTERAREPGASTTCFNKLFKKLSVADRRGLPEETLKDPYNALFDLKNHHNHITKEIALIVEESKNKPPEKGLLHRLQNHLYMAERVLTDQRKLTTAYVTLEDLYNHLKINRMPPDHEKLMRELRAATQEAKDEHATTESLHHLQKKLEAAEYVYVDPTRLVASYEALDNLKHRLYEVVDDLNEFTFEAKTPSADLTCVLNLQKQLDLAEGMLISEKHLKVPYEVLEELKLRLNAMKHLHDLTEIALGPTATPYCLLNLEKEVDVAKNMGIGKDKVKKAEAAADLLKKRLKAKDDLKAVIHESKNLKAGHPTLDKLRTALDVLQNLGIPEEHLKDGRHAFEMLRKRLNAMEELKHVTNEANQPTVSRSCLEKIQALLKVMEEFHIPEDQLKASYDASYCLVNKLRELDELAEIIEQAKKTSSDRHVLEKLERQLQTCVNLDILPLQLQDGVDAVEKLNNRVEVLEGLKDLSLTARNTASGRSCLVNLSKQIEMAEEVNITSEILDEARRTKEILKLRIKILDELNSLTEEAILVRPVTKEFYEKLQRHIELAKTMKVPEHSLKSANEAFTLLTKQLEVLDDLKTTITEARDPNATLSSVTKLEKTRSAAEDLHIPEDYLKESQKVLEMLNRRLKVMAELDAVVAEAGLPKSGKEESINLKKHIQEAEGLLITQSQLQEAHNVLGQLAQRITTRKKLVFLTEEASVPTAAQSHKDKLQECIQFAQDLQIPEDELTEPQRTLDLLEERLTARESLRIVTEEARDPASSHDCARRLQHAMNEVKDLGIPHELISDSNQVMQILKKRIRIVQDLKPITDDAEHPDSDFLAMKRLRKQLDVAEVLRIPPEITEPSNIVFKKLFERMERIKDSLMECKLRACQANANVYTLRSMQDQIDHADSLHIPKEEYPEAYKAYKSLKGREKEVDTLKMDLRNALSSVDTTFMRNALQKAISSSDFRNWNPEDTEWKELLKKAEDVQGTLMLRDAMKSSLENAIKDKDIEPDDLEEKIQRFEMYVDMEIHSPDRQCIMTARKKLIDITRYRVLLKLQRAIGMRSNAMLLEALNNKKVAFETRMKDYDLGKDAELTSNIEKAEELVALFAQIERMKSVVMSLRQPTISEIRSYIHPPVDVRKVMEATYILLGEDKKNVEHWHDIQALVGKIGKDALKRRIWERDLDDIHSHDAEIANELIANLKVEAVEELSKAASVFYCWSLCVIKEVQDRLPSHRRGHSHK